MSIDTLAVVRSIVGRRHRITSAEMIAILEALAAAGVDIVAGSTITGRGADGKLYVGGRWIDDVGIPEWEPSQTLEILAGHFELGLLERVE